MCLTSKGQSLDETLDSSFGLGRVSRSVPNWVSLKTLMLKILSCEPAPQTKAATMHQSIWVVGHGCDSHAPTHLRVHTHTHTRTLTHLPPRTYTLIGVRPLALMHTHTHTDLSPPFTETRIGAHKYAFWTRTLAQKWSRLAGRALQIASDCQIEKKYLNSSEVDVWALVGFQLFKYLASQLVFG